MNEKTNQKKSLERWVRKIFKVGEQPTCLKLEKRVILRSQEAFYTGLA